ncbi:MAG: N-acetylmuramoyl-L-alanine amidase, partial [Candidatus Binataceae bacterium]
MIRAAIALAASLVFAAASAAAEPCVRPNFAVAIDIGHTPTHPGATSARGATEYSFNQELGRQMLEELRARGFSASFIVEQTGEGLGLFQRTERAQKEHASLFLSIHHDSVQPRFLSAWTYQGHSESYSDQFHGYSIFYSQRNRFAAESLEFCRLLGAALRAREMVPTLHHAAKIPGENRDLVDPERGIYR